MNGKSRTFHACMDNIGVYKVRAAAPYPTLPYPSRLGKSWSVKLQHVAPAPERGTLGRLSEAGPGCLLHVATMPCV